MSKNNTQQNSDEDIELLHRALIEEEDLDESKFPEDIRELISEFNALEESYEENQTEENFYKLQELDATIADEIQSLIEDEKIEDENEEDYDPNEDDSKKNPPVPTKSAQEKIKEAKDAKAAQAAKDAQAQAEKDAKAISDAKAIADEEAAKLAAKASEPTESEVLLSKINSKLVNGKISNEDLCEILGLEERADENEYKIGDITLRKVYLGDGKYYIK